MEIRYTICHSNLLVYLHNVKNDHSLKLCCPFFSHFMKWYGKTVTLNSFQHSESVWSKDFVRECYSQVECDRKKKIHFFCAPPCGLETVQDVLIKLGIKPLMHLLEISTFSLQGVLALCEFHYCKFHYCGITKIWLMRFYRLFILLLRT